MVAESVDSYYFPSETLTVFLNLKNIGNIDVDRDRVEIIDDSGNWQLLTLEIQNKNIGGSLRNESRGKGYVWL